MNSEEYPGPEAGKEALRTRDALRDYLLELKLPTSQIGEIMILADIYAYTVGMQRVAEGLGRMVGDFTVLVDAITKTARNMVADVKKGFEDIGKGGKRC